MVLTLEIFTYRIIFLQQNSHSSGLEYQNSEFGFCNQIFLQINSCQNCLGADTIFTKIPAGVLSSTD